MSYLLFGAIDQLNADITRLSGGITALQTLGFTDDHPAIIAIREKLAKTGAELEELNKQV